jgi:hypothetical protein
LGERSLRARAAQMAARLSGREAALSWGEAPDEAPHSGFTITDGHTLFTARVVENGRRRLVVFAPALPPPGTKLWVVETAWQAVTGPNTGVICFAADALIATPDGPRPIDALNAEDLILTRDEPVVWVGKTGLSSQDLRRRPDLRPIRIRAGALGGDKPGEDLLVSPHHRILLSNAKADTRALFNTDEVLVAAADMVDGRHIAVDAAISGVAYVHLLLERHQVIFANGVASESFHPAFAAEQALTRHRAALMAVMPDIVENPEGFGPTARRCLSKAETALLAA